MAESTVKVNFLGDTSKLKSSIDDVDGAAGKAESGFGKLGKAIGGAVAVGGAVSLAKGAFDAAIESQKIGAQTEAVIKSTGGAAGLTADQIGKLSSALSTKNGVDDEAIQSGQNLLLTFTNIQDAAGEGNDIFSQSSQIMVDMAAAMGTDVKGGAIQLGKALNDPIAGISALSRVGVTFTDQQKDQIKAMQESGDMAGAQRVILAELTKEFGGSAAAQATSTDRMKIAMGNLQESIGAKLIPVVERFSNWMVQTGIPAMQRFAEWISVNVVPVVERMGEIMATVIGAVADWWNAHWEQIRSTTETVINTIRGIVETVFGAIEAFWRTWGGTITDYLTRLWDGLRQIIEGALNVIRGIINVVMGLIHGDFSQVWDGIKGIFSGVWEAINGLVDVAINEVRTRIEVVMRIISGVFDAAWDGIKSVFSGAWDAIKNLADEGVGKLLSAIEAVPGKIVALVGSFLSAGRDLGGAIVNGLIDGVKGIASGALDFAGAFADAVKSVVNTQIIDRINSALEFTVPIPFAPDFHVNPPDIPHLAKGGIVTSPTLALIGEAGPEAVVPLSKMGGMGNVINLTVNVSAPDRSTGDYAAAAVAASVRRELAVSLRGAVA